MIIQDSSVGLCIFLLMLRWHCKKNLFNFLLLCQELHHGPREPVFEVGKNLHLMAHVIMHWHEHRSSCHTKPVNQLVADIWEACNSFEIVLLVLEEVFKGLVVFVGTTFHDDAFPLSQANLLETLLQKGK